MALDHKYGRVSFEHGHIGTDEPVFVFRAKDRNLPKVLMYYHLFCMKTGSPKRHLDGIYESMQKVIAWQQDNPTQIKNPNSETSRSWMDH